MTITHEDLEAGEDLGRRVLVRARIIAPCLDSLTGDARFDAIAILKGVVAELPAAGEGRLRSLSRNGTSMTFAEAIGSAFDGDAAAALRSLCAATSRGGLPQGSFPAGGSIGRVWPESYT